jgi:hypothetical protein
MAAINKVVETDPDDGMALYNCASVHSILGMEKKALEFMKKSFARGTTIFIEWIDGDPSLDKIRNLPEFHTLISKYSL